MISTRIYKSVEHQMMYQFKSGVVVVVNDTKGGIGVDVYYEGKAYLDYEPTTTWTSRRLKEIASEVNKDFIINHINKHLL